jgi:transcriptional regulator with XRE-family HTH domain
MKKISIGKYLKLCRRNKKIKAADVIRTLDVSQSFLYFIEQGRKSIPAKTLKAIIKIYGISPQDLKDNVNAEDLERFFI